MKLSDLGQSLPATAVTTARPASIFRAPYDAFDDAALLAHYRSVRPVQYYPVVDHEETRLEKIEALMQGVFEFNGETHALPDPVDWLTNPSRDIEWHILLHKFYYAVGLGLRFQSTGASCYAERWVALIASWLRETPAGFIAADVTGRRVQNWIYSYHQFVTHAGDTFSATIDPAFHRRLLASIHEQVEFLCENLTPKRNHRTLELYAIFLAGIVFPEMCRAAHWRAFALEQIVLNMESDLLPDGVQCELSTDYHHLVLRNYLHVRRLAALNGLAVPARMDAALQRALEFSMHVHKPDGTVPSLSDGDIHGYLELLATGAELYGRADMLFVATRGARGVAPAERMAHFASSGYSVVRSDWGRRPSDFADAQYLVFDSGPVGEGNHGHFDCLNFELAAFGRSLVVDPGRFTYSECVSAEDGINWRVHFRGTAVHNTVCVDGLQQTRYVPKAIKEPARHPHGSVRHKISGPAPAARLVERSSTLRLDLLHGEARSFEYDAVHNRCIVFVDRRYWIVSDWLRAGMPHDYVLNFQLGAHAEGLVELASNDALRVRSPNLLIAQPARANVHHALVPGWVSARYGEKQPAPALRSSVTADNADFDTVLAPWQHEEPCIDVADLTVEAAGAFDGVPPRALQIRLNVASGIVTDTWFHARGAAPLEWRVGRFQFTGRWLFWRESADGAISWVASHAGALVRDINSNGCVSAALQTEEAA